MPDQPKGWRSGATLHYRTILCATMGGCGPGHTNLSTAGRSIDPGPVLSGQAFCRTNCFLGPYGPAHSRTATKPYPGRNQIITPGRAPGHKNLLSLNATVFTKAVNQGLTCAFVHRPSSEGEFKAQRISGLRLEEIRGRRAPGLPSRSAGIRGRSRYPGPGVTGCGHGDRCSTTAHGYPLPAP